MLNQIILIGRLARDPELRYTPSGVAVASFTLAIGRNFVGADGQRGCDFIDCVAWRQLGQQVEAYTEKGRLVAVAGRLQVDGYTDKRGQKRTQYRVVADQVSFLSPRGKVDQSDEGNEELPFGGSVGNTMDNPALRPVAGDLTSDTELAQGDIFSELPF